MALELLPDGTFKKLSKVQTDALNRYYKRENKRDLTTEAIISGLPIILGVSIASIAYVFRDTIKEQVLTALEEESIGAGLWVAKGLTKFFRGEKQKTEPMTPDLVPSQLDPEVMVEIPRCTRYATDYANQNTIAEGIPFGFGTVFQALSQLHTIQAMKLEGCSKPDIIPQSQWDQG
jgi:hypothetical protein